MKNNKLEGRLRRKGRIRKKISGSAARPRLTVFRSDRHIYAQLVDDEKGVTIASASTLEKSHGKAGANLSNAQAIGARIAERAKAAQIQKAVFDRNGYIFHGCIKALADAAREAGLEF